MHYDAISQFVEAFRENAKPVPELDAADLSPRLSPVTLAFRHRGLERDYLDSMRRQTAAVVRFGILLALMVFMLFGALDLWIAAEHIGFTWTLRAAIFVATIVLFGVSFTPVFADHREIIMTPFCLMLGLGVTAIIAVAPDTVVDQYYVGYILIVIGAYTVLGLRFFHAALVSASLLALYLMAELMFRDHAGTHTLNNSTFMLSTMIISAVGGYIYERQRRLAHFRLRVIEHERARSEHSALHDALTGLPNRRLLLERLAQAVERDKRFHTSLAVLFIDLDAFKRVNDTHGHVFGDKLLKCVADRLKLAVRNTDTVARLGGDEFVVLLEDLDDSESAGMLIRRIRDHFEASCEIDGISVPVEPSIGCALHPRDGRTSRELLQAADKSMYRMKQNHGRR